MEDQLADSDALRIVFPQIMHLYFSRAFTLLESAGLHPGQAPMLIALVRRDGASQKELVEQLKVKPPTVTVMLQRMERAGLVQRRQDQWDQRVTRIFLTDKGRGAVEQLEGISHQIEQETFRGFSPEEILLMKRFLVQIRENLSAFDPPRARGGRPAGGPRRERM